MKEESEWTTNPTRNSTPYASARCVPDWRRSGTHPKFSTGSHCISPPTRSAARQAFAAIDAIEADKDLTSEAKRRKQHERAAATIARLDEQTVSLEKARESVARQMQRWNEKVTSVVKPFQTEAEALLHGEIRRHVASLKDERERMAFLEKNGADARVASALLEAPAFLSGIGNAELALIKAKVEKQCLSPEIVEAKAKVEKALAELERAPQAASSMIASRAGMNGTTPSLAVKPGSWVRIPSPAPISPLEKQTAPSEGPLSFRRENWA